MIISHTWFGFKLSVDRRTDLLTMKQMPATNVNRCGRGGGGKKSLTSDAIAHAHAHTRLRMKETCFPK